VVEKPTSNLSNAPSRAVVLLSGGMDSCVCAALAARDHQTAAVHVSYGQRTEERERRCFESICERLGIHDRLLVHNEALRAIGGSALTDPNIDVPSIHAPSIAVPGIAVPEAHGIGLSVPAAGIPVTYVPFRNAHFLSAAVSWAEVIGADAIVIGAVYEDSSGYPDCRPEYYRAFQEVIRAGTRPETHIEIVTPVIRMRKSEIVRRGAELGAPLQYTWSCYQSEDAACGACDSCRLRLRAFAEAGVPDPIAYRKQAEVAP
jgi:7-cyano-7-deazaguanine synthase